MQLGTAILVQSITQLPTALQEGLKESMEATVSGWEYSCDFEVDYGSNKHATIVLAALDVDKELQPYKVKRKMTISEGKLLVHFEATEARFLRASFSAFTDLMILATKIIEEFGQNDDHVEQK